LSFSSKKKQNQVILLLGNPESGNLKVLYISTMGSLHFIMIDLDADLEVI
jgi:hypothetical protein